MSSCVWNKTQSSVELTVCACTHTAHDIAAHLTALAMLTCPSRPFPHESSLFGIQRLHTQLVSKTRRTSNVRDDPIARFERGRWPFWTAAVSETRTTLSVDNCVQMTANEPATEDCEGRLLNTIVRICRVALVPSALAWHRTGCWLRIVFGRLCCEVLYSRLFGWALGKKAFYAMQITVRWFTVDDTLTVWISGPKIFILSDRTVFFPTNRHYPTWPIWPMMS